MWKIGRVIKVPGEQGRKVARAAAQLLLIAVMMTALLPAPKAEAALSAVGATVAIPGTTPAVSFPSFYKDANGVALRMCLDGLPNCSAAVSDMDPASSFPPATGEAFYFNATVQAMEIGSGRVTLVLATEAAYATLNPLGKPQAGQEITFSRIAVRGSGLTPNATYGFVHPYGTETVAANDSGTVRLQEDIGCAANPCDFAVAMTSRLGPFLVWDPAVAPAAPAGFIGDAVTPHKVIGSPTGNNFFQVTGPEGIFTTDLFIVEGKRAVAAVADSITIPADANNVPIDVLANDIASPTDTLTVSAVTDPTSGSAVIPLGSGNKWVTYSTQGAFTGSDSFTYTASNGTVTSNGTVNVTVHAGNAAPVATSDTATVAFNGAATTINVLANDTDTNSDSIFVSAITQGAKGTVAVGTAGRNVTYTPTAGAFGADSFTYTVSDGLATATGTVNVTINRAPVGVNDTATITANTSNNAISVLANDTDPDGNALTVSAVTQPSHGSVAIGTAGANVLYTPAPGYGGADSFTYTLSDGSLTASATVNLTVDRAPVAVNDSITVTFNSTNNALNVLANDTDADGNTLTVTAITIPAHGLASIGPGGGNIIYTPNAGYGGADAFNYTISDGILTASATVNVTVNRSPVAVGDSTRIAQNSSGTAISVLANDTDPDGNALAVSAVTQPAHGTSAVGTAGANVTYTPLTGFAGNDSFSYTVSDGTLTASGTVTVTIERAPFAVGDSATVAMNSSNSTINVLANDLDPDGNPLTVVSVTQGTRGTVSFPPGGANVTYMPNPGFFGADSFTYTISDGLLTDSATVNVTVNRAPVAVGDSATVVGESSNNPINVLANDSDPDVNSLSVTAVTQGASGSVSVGPAGSNILYTPNAGFLGPDSFSYTISDGFLTSSASVSITVRVGNRAPVAVADSYAVSKGSSNNLLDVMANDSDQDANPILIAAATQGAHGSTVVDAGGHHVSYTPSATFVGSDSFTYTITDGSLTASASVAIIVNNVVIPPVAVNDSYKVPKNSGVTMLHLLANDSDPGGNLITIATVGQAAHGTVTVTSDGAEAEYTPTDGFSGSDSFTYIVSNGAVTSTATVAVAIHATNNPPVATKDSVTVTQGSTENHLFLLSNDSDPDGDQVAVSAATQPLHGTVVVPGDGDMVHYTPAAGFAGTDSFNYTVKDGLLTSTATVLVAVIRSANSAPTAINDDASILRNSASNHINVLANDSDSDGDSVTVTAVGLAAHGAVIMGSAGADVIYTPGTGYSGADAFTYTISDGFLTASASVAIIVAADRPPVAAGDSFALPMNSANNPLNVLGNDNDPDGRSLAVSSVGSAANGTVSIGVAGLNVIYTPNPGFTGADSFSYTVTDGAASASATANITVHGANNPPLAIVDTATVRIGSGSNSISVLFNDSDPDGDPLSVIGITQGSKGSVAIAQGRGGILYTPNPGASGSDSFTYTINDGALTATATVNVAIQGARIFMPVVVARITEAW